MPSFGHNGTGKTVLLNGVAKCLCLENLKNGGQAACDGVDLELSDTGMLSDLCSKWDFDVVYFGSYREADVIWRIQNLVSDLRRRMDACDDVAGQKLIRLWFGNFRKLLAEVYQDDGIQMRFTDQGECLIVGSDKRVSRFSDLSGGIAAVLEIVGGLMYRFGGGDPLAWPWIFERGGVVFVLSSMKDAVAYDLERKKLSEGLTYHSFEVLARVYFGVEDETDIVA